MLTQDIIQPEWIVQDMLPRGTIVVLAGEAGAGKSYLCYSLAYAASLGKPFLGFPTKETRIVYFDEENGEPDFLQYNQWAWAALGCPDEPETMTQLDKNLDLQHHTLLSGWKMTMRSVLRAHQPGLVIVDTCTPAFHVKDENDNAEASRVLHDLREMRQAYAAPDTTFLLLKHEKQREDTGHRRTIRGAKGWLGACDQTLYHVIPQGARRRRDGLRRTVLEPDKLRAFALRHSISIEPEWTDGTVKGLKLQAKLVVDGPAQKLDT